ncbi:hypothetical protein XH79_07050 [Bradyrhizobium sp. CCBAU 45389]|nr:hypothetical protein [Bradyrhizobium sp. CCBAU 45389]
MKAVTKQKADRACAKELKILARVERDVFLGLEEIYSMHMRAEHQSVRARCHAILRAGSLPKT